MKSFLCVFESNKNWSGAVRQRTTFVKNKIVLFDCHNHSDVLRYILYSAEPHYTSGLTKGVEEILRTCGSMNQTRYCCQAGNGTWSRSELACWPLTSSVLEVISLHRKIPKWKFEAFNLGLAVYFAYWSKDNILPGAPDKLHSCCRLSNSEWITEKTIRFHISFILIFPPNRSFFIFQWVYPQTQQSPVKHVSSSDSVSTRLV